MNDPTKEADMIEEENLGANLGTFFYGALLVEHAKK